MRLAKIVVLGTTLAINAGMAFAQSSNTMYGTVDVCGVYSRVDSDNKRTAIESGCHDASIIGWRIREAIAPGLNAVARLEYGLAVDQNAGIGSPQFGSSTLGRQGYVGLGGDFGEVSAGRMSSPVKYLQFFDPVGGNVFSGLIALLPTPINSRADPTHFSNAVRYVSPTMGGWQSYAIYSLAPYAGDDKTYDNNQERAALLATHFQGQQAAFFASNQLTRHLGNVSPLTLRDSTLAVSWDFSRIKLSGIMVHSERSTGSTNRIFDQGSIGLLFHCTESDSIGIQASRLHEHDRDDADATSMGLVIEHNLSKRSVLYAGYNLTLNEDAAQFSADRYNRPAPGDSASLFATGIRHNF